MRDIDQYKKGLEEAGLPAYIKGDTPWIRVRYWSIFSRYTLTNNAPMAYTLSATIFSRYEIARIHLSH